MNHPSMKSSFGPRVRSGSCLPDPNPAPQIAAGLANRANQCTPQLNPPPLPPRRLLRPPALLETRTISAQTGPSWEAKSLSCEPAACSIDPVPACWALLYLRMKRRSCGEGEIKIFPPPIRIASRRSSGRPFLIALRSRQTCPPTPTTKHFLEGGQGDHL